MFDFRGKVAAVTGASGIGIGFAIAKRFYEAGAAIGICSRSGERIQRAAEQIGHGDTGRICAFAADTSRVEEIEAFIRGTVQRFGRLDILINNAGIENPMPSVSLSEEIWDEIMDVNLKGYFFGSQTVAKQMLSQKTGGNIVNIGSVNAFTIVVGQTPYAVSKAGVSHMTEMLAREWARSGIRVNCVAPGSIPTLINKEKYEVPGAEEEMCLKIPMGRRGKTDEVADAALYLASDYASYITGQTLYVDGGLTLVRG